jgi:hypothetical protein
MKLGIKTLLAIAVITGCLSTASAQMIGTVDAPLDSVSTILELSTSAYPAALPNDGYSESTLKVELKSGVLPLEGMTVKAQVQRGGGSLIYSEAVTDSRGVATFPFRAGLAPEPAEVAFSVTDHSAQATLAIPLGSVT